MPPTLKVFFVELYLSISYSSRKYPLILPPLPPQKGMAFPGYRGLCKTKKLKKCMKFNRNFTMVGGHRKQTLPWQGQTQGGAPLRSDVTDWRGKHILKANTNKASSQGGGGKGRALPAPSPKICPCMGELSNPVLIKDTCT